MKPMPLVVGDDRKRANVDTVASILERKGREIVSIPPDATVYDAIAGMARAEVGALLVLSESGLAGIISERDYARKVILRGKSSRDTLVREIMTPSPLVTVPLSFTVDECLRLVSSRHVRHLPVVENGELLGMVSIRDLVTAIISSQAYTIDQLHTYITTDYPT